MIVFEVLHAVRDAVVWFFVWYCVYPVNLFLNVINRSLGIKLRYKVCYFNCFLWVQKHILICIFIFNFIIIIIIKNLSFLYSRTLRNFKHRLWSELLCLLDRIFMLIWIKLYLSTFKDRSIIKLLFLIVKWFDAIILLYITHTYLKLMRNTIIMECIGLYLKISKNLLHWLLLFLPYLIKETPLFLIKT